MKPKHHFLLLILLLSSTLSFCQTYPGNLKDAVILSLKAGYHTGDRTDEARFGFPSGPVFDISGEFHLGKGWFIGMNYDFWWTDDEVRDNLLGKAKRSNKGSDYILIGRFRKFFKTFNINAGLGLGFSYIKTSVYFPGFLSEEEAKMFNYSLRLGAELFLSRNFLISVESIYFGMGEFNFNAGGGPENKKARMFQFKAGVGYVLLK
jgi:opacity protein-like surface antigen